MSYIAFNKVLFNKTFSVFYETTRFSRYLNQLSSKYYILCRACSVSYLQIKNKVFVQITIIIKFVTT